MHKGNLLAFLAFALFAAHDAGVKGIGSALPVFEIGFLTGLFALIVLAAARPRSESWRRALRMNRPGLVLLRAAAGLGAGLLGIAAFTRIPLAEAYALIFLAPLAAVVLGKATLGEIADRRRWAAVAVGLVGTLLVIRPGFRALDFGHLAAAGAAVCIATSILVLRAIGRSEQQITILGVTLATSIAVTGLLMTTVDVRWPAASELALLAAAGTGAALGQLALMGATRHAEAGMVAPAQYSQLAWAVIFGALIFGEIPALVSIIGLVLIAISGLLVLQRRPG